MEARQYKTNVVFGICNKNFTQFRKMRYFDSKVKGIVDIYLKF